MTISQTIAPHLPYLRRFARVLTGNQASGDSYAIATLEAIVANPACFETALEPKVALFKVFLRVWGSIALVKSQGGADLDRADAANADDIGLRRLGALAPRSRVAFVLSSIEGFDHNQISLALDCALAQTVGLLHEASQELAREIATDVLIIEDEPIIAMDLQALVEGLGHRVTNVARTRRQAVAAAENRQPGLILADVQLADGSSGIDAVNDILGAFNVPVIFITAYPERLLTGERPEPAFIISKPFRHEMLSGIISQALFFDQKSYSQGAARSIV